MSTRRSSGVRTARTLRLRRSALVVVALFSVGVGLLTYGTSVLRALDLDTMNTRFDVRGSEKAVPGIVIVAVDSRTFAALSTSWPFCYRVHGQLINDIAAEAPRAIAYDIQLSDTPHPGCGGTSDQVALIQAVQNSGGRVVLGWAEDSPTGQVSLVGSNQGQQILAQIGGHAASTLVPADPGGVNRRVGYVIDALPTLAVETTRVATGRSVSAAPFGGPSGTQWIDFAGPSGTYPTVSFSQVILHQLPAGFFHDKIVVVGATTETLQDIHPTPVDNLMPGPEIQANSIATVLRNLPLRSAPGWLDVLIIIALGSVAPLAGLAVGPVRSLALAAGFGAAFVIGAQLAFNSGLVLVVIYPLLALVLSTVFALGVHLVLGAMERERVRDLFSRFVPEDVVDEVLARTDGLRLGGVQREATVMFTDLRGFTTFAESLAPDRVIDVLNTYLSEMSEAILDHSGTLVSYMGDGIMAVFGAPIESSRHADQALACAREMLQVRLPRFNRWLQDEGLSEGFRMGIGLNSGHVMSGNVGSEQRVEYAAVGDTTNSASRLESLTKGTPHQLFLSGSTKDTLTEPPSDLAFVREEQLRGRVGKIGVWTLQDDGAAAGETPPDTAGEPAAVQ